MKKNVILFLILGIFLGGKTNAQNDPISELNAQLRVTLGQLVNPTPSVRFLYDLSVHQVDSVFFSKYNEEPNNTNNWFMLYKEMYYAAYDTVSFITPEDIAVQAINYHQRDTIPLGLMEVSYNKLKYDAINTGDYFYFDTLNNVWYDKYPRPESPYDIDTLFVGATLYPSSHFSNVSFVVNPLFFYY